MNFTGSQAIPEGSESVITGVQFIAADENSPYGTVIFTSSEELVELYLQIDGENGYYSKSLTSSDIANFANGSYAYSVDLDFAPGLNADKQSVMVSGKSIQGKVSKPKDSENSLIDKLGCDGSVRIFGEYAGFIGSFDMGANSGSFKFEYETYVIPDEITIYGNPKAREAPIFHYPSGGTQGWKQATVNFSERNITVKVIGSAAGTAWDFKVHCPAGDVPNSCGSASSTSSFTDSRDGKVYGTVKIGSQTWMAENLDYNTPYGNICYDHKYGRLYTWGVANTACPSGWHLPSKYEWDILRRNAGNRFISARCLKATSGWDYSNNSNGQDAYGFAALPGGYGSYGTFLYHDGEGGYWWTSSEHSYIHYDGRQNAYCIQMSYEREAFVSVNDGKNEGVLDADKALMFSVRCIQD
jgi:uncharacterized protein (TIGR02145 family)